MPFGKALAALALAALAAVQLSAFDLKIASKAPENTPWGLALNRMAADWARLSGGEVGLKIFHSGIAGDEADMLRKLRIGQIQGAVFTSFGLNMITPEILTLSAPLLISTDAELDYVLEANREWMRKKIEEKGFVVLAWSKAGWVRFFSRKPVAVPEDLKRQKLATSPADPALAQAFKSLGYQMVPVPLSETLVALSSGMADAVYLSPLAAGGMQFFGVAKYMTDLRISPFLGAVVLSSQAWNRISPELRAKLLEYAKAQEKALDSEVARLEEEAIRAMKGYGLIVQPVSPEQARLWKEDAALGLPKSMGISFDREFYDRIAAQLVAFRAGKK